MKMKIRIFFRIMTQGPPNPGFMEEKVQKGDFLKKNFFFALGLNESPEGLEY